MTKQCVALVRTEACRMARHAQAFQAGLRARGVSLSCDAACTGGKEVVPCVRPAPTPLWVACRPVASMWVLPHPSPVNRVAVSAGGTLRAFERSWGCENAYSCVYLCVWCWEVFDRLAHAWLRGCRLAERRSRGVTVRRSPVCLSEQNRDLRAQCSGLTEADSRGHAIKTLCITLHITTSARCHSSYK